MEEKLINQIKEQSVYNPNGIMTIELTAAEANELTEFLIEKPAILDLLYSIINDHSTSEIKMKVANLIHIIK